MSRFVDFENKLYDVSHAVPLYQVAASGQKNSKIQSLTTIESASGVGEVSSIFPAIRKSVDSKGISTKMDNTYSTTEHRFRRTVNFASSRLSRVVGEQTPEGLISNSNSSRKQFNHSMKPADTVPGELFHSTPRKSKVLGPVMNSPFASGKTKSEQIRKEAHLVVENLSGSPSPRAFSETTPRDNVNFASSRMSSRRYPALTSQNSAAGGNRVTLAATNPYELRSGSPDPKSTSSGMLPISDLATLRHALSQTREEIAEGVAKFQSGGSTRLGAPLSHRQSRSEKSKVNSPRQGIARASPVSTRLEALKSPSSHGAHASAIPTTMTPTATSNTTTAGATNMGAGGQIHERTKRASKAWHPDGNKSPGVKSSQKSRKRSLIVIGRDGVTSSSSSWNHNSVFQQQQTQNLTLQATAVPVRNASYQSPSVGNSPTKLSKTDGGGSLSHRVRGGQGSLSKDQQQYVSIERPTSLTAVQRKLQLAEEKESPAISDLGSRSLVNRLRARSFERSPSTSTDSRLLKLQKHLSSKRGVLSSRSQVETLPSGGGRGSTCVTHSKMQEIVPKATNLRNLSHMVTTWTFENRSSTSLTSRRDPLSESRLSIGRGNDDPAPIDLILETQREKIKRLLASSDSELRGDQDKNTIGNSNEECNPELPLEEDVEQENAESDASEELYDDHEGETFQRRDHLMPNRAKVAGSTDRQTTSTIASTASDAGDGVFPLEAATASTLVESGDSNLARGSLKMSAEQVRTPFSTVTFGSNTVEPKKEARSVSHLATSSSTTMGSDLGSPALISNATPTTGLPSRSGSVLGGSNTTLNASSGGFLASLRSRTRAKNQPTARSLHLVQPQDLEMHRREFFVSGCKANPQFTYSHPQGCQQVVKLFKVKTELLEVAEKILEKCLGIFETESKYLETDGGALLNEEQTLKLVNQYLDDHGLQAHLDVTFTENGVAPTLVKQVSRKKSQLVINKPIKYRQKTIAGVLHHEIGTHLIRKINESRASWFLNRTKFRLKGYSKTEEGLAAINQLYDLAVDEKRQPFLWTCALYYYVAVIASKMSFVEMFQHLERFVDDPSRRWYLCVRVKRGMFDTADHGGLYKDQVYLEGAVEILRKRKKVDFKMLFSGKLSLEDALRPELVGLAALDSVTLPKIVSENHQKYLKALDRIAAVNEIE